MHPHNYRDLSCQKYGYLTVLERVEDKITKSGNHSIMYKCKCDCGKECIVEAGNLKSGRQVSCGCYNQRRRSQVHSTDLTGKMFGSLFVMGESPNSVYYNGQKFKQYICRCECGRTVEVRGSNLTSGNTKTCNDPTHRIGNALEDLTGNTYQYCKVIERAPTRYSPSGNARTFWKCQCVCGNIFEDWAITIKNGNANCGCKKVVSKGEEEIAAILNENHVHYIREYRFEDLYIVKGYPLKFDFALLKDDTVFALIEFQGEQHEHEIPRSEKDFGKYQREVSDPLKREYCLAHGIPLYEIWYNEDITNKLIPIITQYYHDNTVPNCAFTQEV